MLYTINAFPNELTKLILTMACLLLPFLISSLVLLPLFAIAQTRSIISVGDSHYAETTNSTWLVSPSGDFAFGFLPLNNNTELFLLSIWYANIQEKTIVWYHVNKDMPPATKGSKVALTAGGLMLTDPNGELLWKTEGITFVDKSFRGVLNDTGNFALKIPRFGSVWETFKDPGDTILPSQVLGRGGKLSSRYMESNFSLGRFELLLQNDGNLVMHSINLSSGYVNENYYTSQTTKSNRSSSGTQLVFDMSGEVYVLMKNKRRFKLLDESRPLKTQSYLRATLNFDGVFTVYEHPKNSSGIEGWSPVWSIPDNICLSYMVHYDSGVCGYNNICKLRDDKRPTCQCLKWYSLVDPDDPHGSCKPNFVQGCEEDEFSNKKDHYEFEVLTDTIWPVSDTEFRRAFTAEQCKQSCMEDCMCSVAIFRLGDSCWLKKLPLSNGRFDPTLYGVLAFIKVKKDNSSQFIKVEKNNFSQFIKVEKNNPSKLVPPIVANKKRKPLSFVVSMLLGGSAFIILVFIGALCMNTFFALKYKKQISLLSRVSKSIHAVETNLRCFTYKELEEATNGFEKVVGRGAFGIVYEGVISIGSTTHVAVKKLKNIILQEVEKEFKNELSAIGLTHHKNLVRIVGFCEDGGERMLVYEYMTNGTLASLLFNEEKKPDWNLRLQIAIGVARGLLYLHDDCNTRIIHCDIKPQNILLDDNYNARISDFGLAKLLNMNHSRTSTGIRGTRGYVALEWFKNMPITAKVDVYSYGVLLLEIICCRRNVEVELEDDDKAILTDWAFNCYIKGDLDALVEKDEEALNDKENLEKLVMIAIWCVQDDPELRPTMRNVTWMLEGVVEVQVPPCPSQINTQY